MKHKSKTVLGTVGLATVLLLAGSIPHHLPVKAPTEPYSRPVCNLKREAKAVPLPKLQADCTADVPATSESVPVTNDTVPSPQCAQAPTDPNAAEAIPQEVSSPAPTQREQQANEKTSPPKGVTPQMGDIRMVDGKKQVYFLGFGWIEDNGGGGDGTIVDGEGDINKMVGSMG